MSLTSPKMSSPSELISIGTEKNAKLKSVFMSYFLMFVIGVGVTLLAFVAARMMNLFCPLSVGVINIVEYSGYICWCTTLGMRGWDIQTWEGNSPAELWNERLAKLISIVGVFVFVLAKELIPLA